MQTSDQRSVKSSLFFAKEIFVSMALGLLIGGITAGFIKLLFLVETQQVAFNELQWPLHVLFLPFVLIFLLLLKKRTLYFPTKVSELIGWSVDSNLHWSAWMTPFHFAGALLSHMVGASVGREGVVVLMGAGLVRAMRLSWIFWGPVAMGCGFSAILGNPWIGVIFIGELFKTNGKQKVYILMSSFFANLLMQSLQVHHLISPIDVVEEIGFWKTFVFILALALSSGFIMRFYKWAFLHVSAYFHRVSISLKFCFAAGLAGLLMIPVLRPYQSLGLLQLENLAEIPLGYEIPVLKLALTLFSVCLGFWGGEFIPLVYAGLHFGANLAHTFGFNQLVGTYLGCYLFFAGATRLKWTGFFLILSLLGFSWCVWLLILVNVCVGFSGEKSLYRPHPYRPSGFTVARFGSSA